MKVGRVNVKNFQSYRELDFDYADLGLALISGDTGAGKSTFMDAVAWTLFGITSKGGAADDVRAWDAHGPTEGTAEVLLPHRRISVHRTRAPGKNDLYFTEGEGAPVRGKDMPDTQRLLEATLGVTADLFLVGSYLTQFSEADSFFIAKAKDRRDVLEKIADQEFAIKLGERASEARKDAKKRRDALALEQSRADGTLDAFHGSIPVLEAHLANWVKAQEEKKVKLTALLENFDQTKADTCSAIKRKSMEWQAAQAKKKGELREQLSAIEIEPDANFADALSVLQDQIDALRETRCPECGGPADDASLERLRQDQQKIKDMRHSNLLLIDRRAGLEAELKRLDTASDPHLSGLQQAQRQENPYGAQLSDLAAATNPFESQLTKARQGLETASANSKRIAVELAEAETSVSHLSWLYDKSFELRGLLMARVVSQIEASTNAYLERFFDAALRVQLTLTDSDKLDVEISNGGYSAPFKSLSGGERCMLKLAFSLSLMKAAQAKAGLEFGMVLLDEPFNGLSDILKVKAFGLLQQLEDEYPTVLVIDHSPELKAQFGKVFYVDKTSGNSQVHARPLQ